MEPTDEFGVCALYIREAETQTFAHIICEIIQNRRHNSDKSTAKYLFICYKDYFILAVNQYRTRESIDKEHTPFKFNSSIESTRATISTRGFGAKLFPFYVQGIYSVLFRRDNSEVFSKNDADWGMRDYVNLSNLADIVKYNRRDEFSAEDFRGKCIIPITKKSGDTPERPFFSKEEFIGSPVCNFLEQENFKYFYIFKNPNKKNIKNLEDTLYELARIFEHRDIEIYRSENLAEPVKVEPKTGFGIHPSNWTGCVRVDWRMGEKQTLKTGHAYHSSEFRVAFEDSNCVYHKCIWGKIVPHFSSDIKYSSRLSSFEPHSEKDWRSQFSVTLALVTDGYHDSVKDGNEKLPEYLYLRMEDDLISKLPISGHIQSQLRHLPFSTRTRLIVDIFDEGLKSNSDAGFAPDNVKSKSSIAEGKVIHECIMQTYKIMAKHLTLIKANPNLFINDTIYSAIIPHIHINKTANARSSKRKREGIKFESTVSDYLTEELRSHDIDGEEYDIVWETGDANIMVKHNINFQAIDTLGKLCIGNKTIWLAVQSKDRENSIPNAESDAFINAVENLKKVKQDINPEDKVISVLTLAKVKSFSYVLYSKMIMSDIYTVLEPSDNIGSNTSSLFQNKIAMYQPKKIEVGIPL